MARDCVPECPRRHRSGCACHRKRRDQERTKKLSFSTATHNTCYNCVASGAPSGAASGALFPGPELELLLEGLWVASGGLKARSFFTTPATSARNADSLSASMFVQLSTAAAVLSASLSPSRGQAATLRSASCAAPTANSRTSPAPHDTRRRAAGSWPATGPLSSASCLGRTS